MTSSFSFGSIMFVQCDAKCSIKDGSPRPAEVADELAEALDEDNMHKIQLHRFVNKDHEN